MTTAPSGEQYELVAGGYRAVVVEVGAGLRELSHDGREVLQPYPEDAMCDAAHGAVLVPWPNRLGDGHYAFDGVEHQLALTEPEKRNAIHGLVRWRPWKLLERAAERVSLGTRLYAMQGYPFTLDVRVDYRLGSDGLHVRTTATNVGSRACPYGCGQHPYLSPGDGEIDACVLEIPAATRIVTDAQRQLPTGTEPVDGTLFDFRRPRRIGDLRIDYAFTDLDRDADGRSWVRLHAPDGKTAQLWVGPDYPIVEIFTADTLSSARRRRGLGVEPMTCPPDAFRSGERVVRLEPGRSATSEWGVQLVTTPGRR
ncbi:aldose 1-epimerase family protein [Cumulibacter manganitolerans]|uniref:aldose 1-epimerase family protein n=1 Tax=Cumulibacter manganitolerans TaxID=1884992 RepID=UPI001296E922|nr:aldose 1-epimerase family protein [Cumulibacter manganitolerans]